MNEGGISRTQVVWAEREDYLQEWYVQMIIFISEASAGKGRRGRRPLRQLEQTGDKFY